MSRVTIGPQFPHSCLSRTRIQKAKQDNFQETNGNLLLQNLNQVVDNLKTIGTDDRTLAPHGFAVCFKGKNMVIIVTFIPSPMASIPSDQVLQLLQVLGWISQPASICSRWFHGIPWSMLHCPRRLTDFDTLQVITL